MEVRCFISKMENSRTEQAAKNTPFRSATFSLWLSWQELIGRKVVFSINVILVALLIALPVSLDLMGKARKSSVETRIDYIGPSLILVPAGIMSSELVTAQMKGKTFSSSISGAIKRKFSPYLRNTEARLTTRLFIDGRDVPVVGIDFRNVYSYPFKQYSIGNNDVLLGTIAAEKLHKRKDDTLRVHSQTFTIAGIIPTAGGVDDLSVFLSLPVLQKLAKLEGRINEIRLFPGSASSYQELKSYLKEYNGKLNMIDAYRGDAAERDIEFIHWEERRGSYFEYLSSEQYGLHSSDHSSASSSPFLSPPFRTIGSHCVLSGPLNPLFRSLLARYAWGS
jgi:hypothetical protein